MAQALLRERLAEGSPAGPVAEVASAGIEVASIGSPASGAAVEALAGRGVDLADHRTRGLDAGLLADAALVVAMTRRHEAAVGVLEATARSRTFLAGEVVRLAGIVGPRGDGPVDGGVGALDAARAGHFTAGRVADEVVDPWGGTVDDYRRCADRLDGVCSALARFLAGS